MRQMRISNNQKYLLIGVAFGLGIIIIADSYNPTYVFARCWTYK